MKCITSGVVDFISLSLLRCGKVAKGLFFKTEQDLPYFENFNRLCTSMCIVTSVTVLLINENISELFCESNCMVQITLPPGFLLPALL